MLHTHWGWWGGLPQPLQISCALGPAGWDNKTGPVVMPTEHFCRMCNMLLLKVFTYSSFLLIRRHNKYILNLHHCCNGNNLFGAAKVSWLQEHLGKHGAERKLRHPHTHGISQTSVMVQTCQQTHNLLRFCIELQGHLSLEMLAITKL